MGNPLHAVGPQVFVRSVVRHAQLIVELVKREVTGRYRGSFLGLLWSFFYPVLMLVVYTFVFSVVFKARWQGGDESKQEFALALFAGLLFFNLFSECVARAPGLVTGNVNYVKKVIFPLELLPVVALGSALFHFVVSLLVWLLFYVLFFGVPHAQLLLLPLVLIPLLLITLGLSWLLASLGVYLRDVGQVIGVVVTVLMFLSPIFYPVSALPEAFRPYMQISPLTYVIEQARDLMIWGRGMDWGLYGVWLGGSALLAWLGFAWFQKTRKGFADVL